ncbi:MAG: hypothetical protein ACRD7E_16610 [Bryobacteraceae bacterium]
MLQLLLVLLMLASTVDAQETEESQEQREALAALPPIPEALGPAPLAPNIEAQNLLPAAPAAEPAGLPVKPEAKLEPGVLSPKEKAMHALRNTIGLPGLGKRVFAAAVDHWQDEPQEWGQGWDALGRRAAYGYSRLAIRNGIRVGLDLAFKTDPRYDRCNCDGFLPRAGHAVRRVFIARKDNGGEMLNIPRIASAYGTAAITQQYWPDRYNTTGNKLGEGTSSLAIRTGTNMLREFWPDIRRAIFRK